MYTHHIHQGGHIEEGYPPCTPGRLLWKYTRVYTTREATREVYQAIYPPREATKEVYLTYVHPVVYTDMHPVYTPWYTPTCPRVHPEV